MAIAFRAAGAALFGVNSIAPVIPTAQVVGDMMLLIAAVKPYNAGWSVSGWTALGSGASGTTAAGVDLGSMEAQVWYKEATADPETNPTLTEGSPAWNVAGAAILVFSKAAGEAWIAPVVVYGADETTGTAISVTYASNPGVTANDWVVNFCGINTDAMGPLTGNLTPAQTGVTFGTTTERVEAETTSGGDMSLHATETPVNSGTGSAAPTATGTGTATGGADRLEAGFIRLRVEIAPAGHPALGRFIGVPFVPTRGRSIN